MEDFDAMIWGLSDPAAPLELRTRAMQYLEELKYSNDHWRFCLDKLFTESSEMVKFICLQVLQTLVQISFFLPLLILDRVRLSQLSSNQLELLRRALFSWLLEFLPNHPEEFLSVKNKFCQVFVQFLKHEPLEQWPSFLNHLISLLPHGTVMIDIFLRLLVAFHEEIVEFTVHRTQEELALNGEIKDCLREHCMAQIAGVWLSVLVSFPQTNIGFVNMCLLCIRNFVGWISIKLIANSSFVPLFFQFLSQPVFRDEACECLYEIVTKGMDPNKKAELISHLRLGSILSASNTEDVEFTLRVVKLLNAAGLELFHCLEKIPTGESTCIISSNSIQGMVQDTFETLTQLLSHEDTQVSSSTYSFLQHYLTKFRRASDNSSIPEQYLLKLRQLLTIILSKLPYARSSYSEKDEEEREDYEEFRQNLANLFRSVVRIIPRDAAAFVHAALSTVCKEPSSSLSTIEAALSLFHIMGSVVNESMLKGMEGIDEFFQQSVCMLVNSYILQFDDHVITLLCQDIIIRYARFLPVEHSDSMVRVLGCFLDSRGIRSSRPEVQRRSCYLLQRLMRMLRHQLNSYLPVLYSSLQELLVIPTAVMPFEVQLNLYESLGFVTGSFPSQQLSYVEVIVLPLRKHIADILEKELYLRDTEELPMFSQILSHLIAAIGVYSKGFTLSGKASDTEESDQIRNHFLKSLEVVVIIPKVLPHNVSLRERVLFFLHRMIESLGPAVCPLLPVALEHLLHVCLLRQKDTVEFMVLLAQVATRFKEQVSGIITPVFTHFLGRILPVLASVTTESPVSEEAREFCEIRHQFLHLVLSLLSNSMLLVLFACESHVGHVWDFVLKEMSSWDPSVRRLSFKIVERLVECSREDTFRIDNWMYGKFVPGLFGVCFSVPSSETWTSKALRENVRIQKLLFSSHGIEFLHYVTTVVLPQFSFPRLVIENYCTKLQDPDCSQLAFLLEDMIRSRQELLLHSGVVPT